MTKPTRRPQVCILGSADPGTVTYELAGEAGKLLARLDITLVSGCESAATRFAAVQAIDAGGLVLSIITPARMPAPDWPATVVIPCGMGDARDLLMALAGDACIVVGGSVSTISEVCLAWLHKRPLLPLTSGGGWINDLPSNAAGETHNPPILPWSKLDELESHFRGLGFVPCPDGPTRGRLRRQR